MKQTTFTSSGDAQSVYTIEHNLDSEHVLVDVQVHKDNGWWSWPVATHHINRDTVIVDVIKPMHIRVTFLTFD